MSLAMNPEHHLTGTTVPDTQLVLERAAQHAWRFLAEQDDAPVGATVRLEELRRRLTRHLSDGGTDARTVIDDLVADVEGGLLRSSGGRFFGWVIGGTTPAALAADWLTGTWDQNAGMYACSPAGAVVEEVCGLWLKDLLGLPEAASFALVTGCQMAHVTCLAAARDAVLARRGWDVEAKGMAGAPAITILTGEERHGTVDRAARLLGIGTDNVLPLEVDARGQLKIAALEEALAANRDRPTIVVLQAGDLNIGAYDDFERLIPIAHADGAWVHVDGAFGLWAAASSSYRYLVRGVDRADSWATDGHKWLNVPYDCGYAFVADHEAHRRSMSHRASYLTHASDARDQLDWNPEWSRRGRGFATYAALRELGRSGVADVVERCCRYARTLVRGIGSLPGAQLVWEPTVNQGLVRFLDPAPDASEADHDARNDAVIAGVCAGGKAFFTGTTWRGMRCMRVSVSNWQTDERDVERAIAAVAHVLGGPAAVR